MKYLFRNILLAFTMICISLSSVHAQKKLKFDFAVGFMTDIIGINDNHYNELTWNGIVAVDLSTEYDIDSLDYFIPKNITNYYDMLLEISLYENFDVLLVSSPSLVPILYDVALKVPKMKFIMLGDIIDNRPNVASAIFAIEEGSFLVGMIAAMQTTRDNRNKIGFISDFNNKEKQTYEAGFEAGVRAINSNLEIVVVYTEDNIDPTLGENLAKKMYEEEKVTVIYAPVSFIIDGIFKYARLITETYNSETNRRVEEEALKYKDPVWVIGADRDYFEDGIYSRDRAGIYQSKSVTLTSMIKKYNIAAYEILTRTYDDKFPSGQVLSFNLANNGVGIPDENPNILFKFRKEYEQYLERIKNGSFGIPKTPKRIRDQF